MDALKAFNFREWIDQHRESLKPPVGNQCVFRDSQFIVMVVGGPNARTDYHDDPSDEVFYQLEGDIVLKTIQNGAPVDVPIRAGEMLLLPGHVLHSPQRPANSVGLVIERTRKPHEKEGFVWFCQRCHHVLYSEYLYVSDIVQQLPPIFERFYGSLERRTCKNCGAVMQPPERPRA